MLAVRDRDTTEQRRMKISEVLPYLSKEIDGF
jgi:glycyl-tRNA synthetase (class II)